jgi:Sec1 family
MLLVRPAPSHIELYSCSSLVCELSNMYAITVIESITSHRERQPKFEAMYLLMPTSANVERIIRDFTPGNEQYAAAHLFFLDCKPIRRIEAPVLDLSW